MIVALLLTLAGISGCDRGPAEAPSPGPAATMQQPLHNLDQGQKHPPLPADNPVWSWDAGGFVADPQWYGEHGWPDVRMRVAGHLYTAGRDLSRVKVLKGDLAGAAGVMEKLAGQLQAIVAPTQGVASEIKALLVEASLQDARLLQALAEGKAPSPEGEGLYALRLRYLEQALSPRPDPAALSAIQAALLPFLGERPDLDISGFRDFDDRHRLRVRLWQAALDSRDPLGIHEPWGYWEPAEIRRQALILGHAAALLAKESPAPPPLRGSPPSMEGLPAWRWPTVLAEALVLPEQAPDFTAEELGWLPTGDTLIDVAGEPGPKAIGSLQKLGLEDPEWRARLDREAEAMDAALARDPAELRRLVDALVADIDQQGHGSRFYNIKQVRNAAVRQLARAGHFDHAHEVLLQSWPLHNQDWACPNREGILVAIDGRLLAEAGRLDEAERRLEEAVVVAERFLADVDAAEAAGPGRGSGQRPPMGPPPGQPGPPPGGPPPRDHRPSQ